MTSPVIGYASIDQAKAAGAVGTDTEITQALRDAKIVIDRYTRDLFEPTDMSTYVEVDATGMGYLDRWAASVTVGTLGTDGRTWWATGALPFPTGAAFEVPGDYGHRVTPVPVSNAAARLAALYCPAPFTAQADAEGNPIGRPPAPTQQDETDPAPPSQRQGEADYDRTTGDPVTDHWLEPYKTNRVLI
jgi:hypothetical protein